SMNSALSFAKIIKEKPNELKIIKKFKKDNFYIISIEIVFIYLSWTFLSQLLYFFIITILCQL
ncbi:hypothetical protein LLE79_05870, partial [Staphylococcus epidermidis]